MGIYSKLELLMKANNLSVVQLSKCSGVPASTIYNMKNRDSKRVDIETLYSLASALGVSIDFFVSDKPKDYIVLTDEEAVLICKFRMLDLSGAKCVEAVLECQLERVKKE